MNRETSWKFGLLLSLLTGCATVADQGKNDHPKYRLALEQAWQLNVPNGERFDASGLLWTPDQQLFTIRDQELAVYEISFVPGKTAADLVKQTRLVPTEHHASLRGNGPRYFDVEGISMDVTGQIYLSEEAGRRVFRLDPLTGRSESLEIDWSPVSKFFSTKTKNASFEGIAVGDGKLFLANEREQGLIVVVDLESLTVVDYFQPRAKGSIWPDVHYSDLSWSDGELYLLLREAQTILRVNADSHQVLAEYSYHDIERQKEYHYPPRIMFAGTMEGLAVRGDSFWLVTDNNHQGRAKYPQDRRPTLFKCRIDPDE